MLTRVARAADADAVWGLLAQLVIGEVPAREVFDATYGALVEDAGACLQVCEVDSLVVGYVHAQLRPSLYAGGPVCWVSELVVDEAARGEGCGRALMEAVIAWARLSGAAEVTLATSRADDFYGHLGYEPTARYFKRKL